jgi:hypothetical protein
MSTDATRSRRGLRHQRGQALAEALVGCIALVPLVLLTVLLGKYQSVQLATIDAARHLAFECTVRLRACGDLAGHPQLVDELRIGHFARTDREIQSNDVIDGDATAPERQALWVDASNRPLLERYGDVSARITQPSFDAGEAVAVGNGRRMFAQAAEILSDLAGPGRFGLALTAGLVDARVQVRLSPSQSARSLADQLDSLPLRMTARAAVLTDAWNASGPHGSDDTTVESRVDRGRRLNGAIEAGIDAAYLPTRSLIELAHSLLMEPRGSAFRYHEIDVDLVPPDRLPQ